MDEFSTDKRNGYEAFRKGIPVTAAPLYSSPHCYYWLEGWQKAFEECKVTLPDLISGREIAP